MQGGEGGEGGVSDVMREDGGGMTMFYNKNAHFTTFHNSIFSTPTRQPHKDVGD